MDEGIEYPTDLQLKGCWDKLDKLEVGEKLKTKDNAPNKPKLWIKCCQMYHDCYGNLKFKSDYSEVMKIEINHNFD